VHFPQQKGRGAGEANALLMKRGLVVRQVGAYKLPNALRISVGTEEANRLVVKALADFVGMAK
jgi:histidinol-phosphate aminotransferase